MTVAITRAAINFIQCWLVWKWHNHVQKLAVCYKTKHTPILWANSFSPDHLEDKESILNILLGKPWPRESLNSFAYHSRAPGLCLAQFSSFPPIHVILTLLFKDSLLFLKFNIFSLSHPLAYLSSCLILFKRPSKVLWCFPQLFSQLLKSQT